MSGVETAALLASAGGAGAGTAAAAGTGAALGAGAAGAAGTAGAMGAGAGLAGLGGTALGTTTALGTGISAGAGGLGMAAPAAFGTMGGMSAASAAPGMAGALGSGLAGAASTAPELGAMFASSAVPSSFVTNFTVADAMGKLGGASQNYQKVNSAMKMMQPQQGGGMIDGGQGTFEGKQRQPISPFGQQMQNDNSFARFLMQRRMGARNGLLG